MATPEGIRGLLSFRRSSVASVESFHEEDILEFNHLQFHTAELLAALTPPPSHDHDLNSSSAGTASLLSFNFLSKLLSSILGLDADFRDVLLLVCSRYPTQLARPPTDRIAADFLDRAVKALDILNAASLALHALRHWLRNAEIAAAAGPASPNRALRALSKFLSDAALGSAARGPGVNPAGRSLSFNVSRTWSSGRTVSAMSAHLSAPPTGGMALALYTMSSMMVFVMWTLVAALPCQDRVTSGGNAPVPLQRGLQWSSSMTTLQEKISEEWRRKERRGSSTEASVSGLLAEMQAVETAAKLLKKGLEELAVEEEDNGGGPILEGDRARELTALAEDLAEACREMKNGLGPLERLVRAVFHRLVGRRAEVMQFADHAARSSASPSPGTLHHPNMF